MKLLKCNFKCIAFLIIILFSSKSFCGPVFSKQKSQKSDIYEISFESSDKKVLREKVEELIKTKSDINKPCRSIKYYWVEFGKHAVTERVFILDLAVEMLDVESVRRLLENGANPNHEYVEKMLDLDTLFVHIIAKHTTILNFVSYKLRTKLLDKEWPKYKQIQKLLVFSGANTENWEFPNYNLLYEHYINTTGLIPDLQKIVFDYLSYQPEKISESNSKKPNRIF